MIKRIISFIKLGVLKCYRNSYCSIKRKRLKNLNFSLISNNCIGGVIYHDLGQQFKSPTINLLIKPDDYLVFLENLEESLSTDIIEDVDSQESYPVGIIRLKCGKDVFVHFMHYDSFDNAYKKWIERVKRVDFDNLYILFEMGFSTSEEYIRNFLSLPFKHKAAIVNKKNLKNEPCLHFLDIYNDDYVNGKILFHRSGLLTYKRYLDQFDYVEWINKK